MCRMGWVCKQMFADDIILQRLPLGDFHRWSTQRKVTLADTASTEASPFPGVLWASQMGAEENVPVPLCFYTKVPFGEGNRQKRNEIEETLKVIFLSGKGKGKITGKY